jgi:ABC-type multidrug transport system permease subunit
MLGGSFFPFEVMPAWMASLGQMTPNGWALLRLREIMGGEADAGALLVSFAAGLAIVMALGFLAARRIRGFAT